MVPWPSEFREIWQTTCCVTQQITIHQFPGPPGALGTVGIFAHIQVQISWSDEGSNTSYLA